MLDDGGVHAVALRYVGPTTVEDAAADAAWVHLGAARLLQASGLALFDGQLTPSTDASGAAVTVDATLPAFLRGVASFPRMVTDSEANLNAAVQLLLRAARCSPGGDVGALAEALLWRHADAATVPIAWCSHTLRWLQAAYDGIGELFMASGRVTKSAQVGVLSYVFPRHAPIVLACRG